MIQDLEHLAKVMTKDGHKNLDVNPDKHVDYSVLFTNNMQRQFDKIFNSIIKAISAIQKSQRSIEIFLSLGDYEEN
jgi:hypothetical protein